VSNKAGSGSALRAIVFALSLALALATACGDATVKDKPDAAVDTGGSGSSSPCVLDTSKLDSCSL
jgi:hypothetical protein